MSQVPAVFGCLEISTHWYEVPVKSRADSRRDWAITRVLHVRLYSVNPTLASFAVVHHG